MYLNLLENEQKIQQVSKQWLTFENKCSVYMLSTFCFASAFRLCYWAWQYGKEKKVTSVVERVVWTNV